MKLILEKQQLDISTENLEIKDLLENLPKEKADRLVKIWSTLDFFAIKYNSDGVTVDGYLVIPKKIKRKVPIIIYNRGGSKDVGILNEKIVAARLAEYAFWGYAVIASQLRGCLNSTAVDQFGGGDLNDILILKDVAKEVNGLDTENISMIGGSRGGMMALLALTKIDYLKCVIIEAAPSDIENSYKLRPNLKEFRKDMYDTSSKAKNRKRSAQYFADKITKNTPIIIFHGRLDKAVDICDTYKLAIQLQKNNIPHEIHTFVDTDHMLRIPDKWVLKEKWLRKYTNLSE